MSQLRGNEPILGLNKAINNSIRIKISKVKDNNKINIRISSLKEAEGEDQMKN
jgi:hypothetical protein